MFAEAAAVGPAKRGWPLANILAEDPYVSQSRIL